MKKTLLTILCLLTALCSMAQSERTYTEPLVISTGDGEPTEPQEAQISVVENDASPLTGTNYYKVKAIGQGMESLLSAASAPAPASYNDDNGLEKGLYMGIIGFNEDLIDKGAMSLLAPNTKSSFTSFVNSLTTKKNTLLYYAVDKALDKLTMTPFPNDLRNVAIITFTDGLDQGSLPMINYDPYTSAAEYRNYLDGRIKSTTVQGLSLSAYTIGIRGGDVTNVQEFQNNLVSLASSEENATEVNNMSEVNSRFQDIANQLTSITETQTISIKFPMLDNGQVFRFTFDNVSDAARSQCYIEGTMSVSNNTLNNIRYVGLTCSSGTSIQGTRHGINISFDFVDLKDANGNNLSLDYVKEYYMDGSYWQVNSEFDKGDDIEVTVERSSAAIMLVLDCSSSLQSNGSDKFAEMKTHVKAFIETLAAAMDNVDPMAQTERIYTEQVVILSDDGASEPQEAQISVVENGDGTINFVLKNFMLGAGDDAIAVGNIVVNNLPVTQGEDGLDHVYYDGTITITAGDQEGVLFWLGPAFGPIPVVLDGKMNEEKLYVSLDISVAGTVIPVLIGTDDFFATRIYTEPIVISTGDGEPSEPYEANITVVDKGNQTIDFVLKNFMLSAGDEAIAVGNICIENIPVNRQDDGLDHFFYQGVITIESGDLEDVAYWIGPAFGDIPIAINGKMNEEKLFASIDINMGVSVVTVQVGTDAFSVTVVKGDMNGDTVVDIADAVSVLNMMADGAYTEAADINGDGKIDIADFVGILDIMAGQ